MSDGKRPYRMTKRAESEEQTRLRITESTVALHEQLGPAHTTVSAIAEHAGVRRSTVYRHFPDERALFAACSAHWNADHPRPDPAAWAAIADPAERTRVALDELYAYYGTAAPMLSSLLRDEPLVPVVHERLRAYHGYLAAAVDGLAHGRGLRGGHARRLRAALGHALALSTWSSLADEQGLGRSDAVDLMCGLVEAAAGGGQQVGATPGPVAESTRAPSR